MRRRGFTLIELMVVVLIIAVLAGLLLPALAALRRSRAKAATLSLIEHVTSALTDYLQEHPSLGDLADGSDFAAKPFIYLNRTPRAAGQAPYLELKREQMGIGSTPASGENDAETIIDAFGEPLVFTIVNGTLAGRTFTREVAVTSTLATTDTTDDIGFRYTSTTKQWDVVRP